MPSLFVWRNSVDRHAIPLDYCPYCDIKLIEAPWSGLSTLGYLECTCPLCGFNQDVTPTPNWVGVADIEAAYTASHYSLLKKLDINHAEVALPELATYLSSNRQDLYALDWRRFEELVNEFFSHKGWETQLTQSTKDGGVDIFLLHNGIQQTIVQCKKNAAKRTIGVGLVREIAGTCLKFDVRNAVIVTSAKNF